MINEGDVVIALEECGPSVEPGSRGRVAWIRRFKEGDIYSVRLDFPCRTFVVGNWEDYVIPACPLQALAAVAE